MAGIGRVHEGRARQDHLGRRGARGSPHVLWPAVPRRDAVRRGRRSSMAPLRRRHYDATLLPLGRLLVAHSYSTKSKKEKSVKTEQPRWVPVHEALAQRLADWRDRGGWEEPMGRKPGPDDLIVPSRRGQNRSVNHMLKRFHQDLERLELRPRRQHDARRTFISLAIADGARKDILAGSRTDPKGTSSISTRRCRGTRSARRWRASRSISKPPPKPPQNPSRPTPLSTRNYTSVTYILLTRSNILNNFRNLRSGVDGT